MSAKPSIPTDDPQVLARFWAKVNKTDGCWLWTAKTADGYGRFTCFVGGKQRLEGAHRFSYRTAYGVIPDGFCVLHSCDVRVCVRPSHLFLGTSDDNMRDMVLKGRQARGTGHGQAKLALADVVAIRDLYATGWSTRDIASKFGISQQHAQRIASRKNWSHI